MRESSNETIGLAPYTLLYGTEPRGPLCILKESWTGHKALPTNLNKTERQYLDELKGCLQTARTYAEEHAEQAQANYVAAYNKKAKDKSFAINDTVIVLHSDSTNKLLSKWQLGSIIDVYSEYNYLVEMPSGARKNIHANFLRPFQVDSVIVNKDDNDQTKGIPAIVRIDSLIVDDNDDFGHIETAPMDSSNLLPSQRIDKNRITHLSLVQQQELLTILDEFSECFSDKPGLLTNVEHEIVTTPDFKRKRLKPYKVPEVLKGEIERQIDVLLKDGYIVPSNSDMISPIICVLKPDKLNNGKREIRIVCDFRYLNKYTVVDPFPVPDQQEVIFKLSRFKYITVFDARSGYWHIPVKKESQALLGFATHHGLWQWTRTAFGCKNSGSSFIRAIEQVLKPVRDITATFVDDMGVGASTWDEHLVNLRRFLTIIKTNGVRLNLEKTEFAKSNVSFLGRIVGSNKISMDPAKIEAIVSIKRPTTVKMLKSFLGVINFHREFIPHMSNIAKPLTDMTSIKKVKQLPWCAEHETAFNKLKIALCEAVSLHVPRVGGLFILRTDASGVAISGCLYQREDDVIENVVVTGDGEKPISFYSQKLSRPQMSWSVIEREAYAVIASLKKFFSIVFGSTIIVYSDHNPLTYVVEGSTHSAKLTRWSLALQEYNVIFRYAKAKNNIVADYFSRCEYEAREAQH
jgi:hypothetical protein